MPTTCAGERVPLGVEGPISSGDLRVVDAPRPPASTQQCRSGGWRAFGTRLADQAQCVAYVTRRARAECLAERAALGRAAFRATYGRGPSRPHALRRCVRAHAVWPSPDRPLVRQAEPAAAGAGAAVAPRRRP